MRENKHKTEEVNGNKMLEEKEKNDNEMSGVGNDTFHRKWLKQWQWQWYMLSYGR